MTTAQSIRHGTASGYTAHRRRHEVPCRDCTDAHSAVSVARLRADGRPARAAGRYTTIPTTVLADLYLNATPAAQERAEQATPDGVLDLAVKRYDQENA
jgi:hypothetical protein